MALKDNLRRSPVGDASAVEMAINARPQSTWLPIAQIRRDGQTQPRQGMDEDVINDYVTALTDGTQFPAIDVMFDGKEYWLFDGFHRVESHLRSGRTEIAVKIHQGTLDEAQWRSYAANKDHGLRRSTADKERAIRAALRHPKAPALSNRELARHLGVDDKTVAKYRSEMVATAEIPQSTTRTGADGRSINVENIGKLSDEQIANRVHQLTTWLMGKGWAMFHWSGEQGITKGDHKFAWDRSNLADALEKVKAAEKIERAAIEAAKVQQPEPPRPPADPPTYASVASLEAEINNWLISLGAQGKERMPSDFLSAAINQSGTETVLLRDYLKARNVRWSGADLDTAMNNVRNRIIAARPSPSMPPNAKRPLTLDESITIILRTLNDNWIVGDPDHRLTWLNKHSQPTHYEHALPAGTKLELSTFCTAWASVAGEQRKAIEAKERTEAQAAKYAPQPDQPTELETQPTAVELQLPSITIPDKDLFVEQVKRSVGVLGDEGYATVANFLRIVGRYAYDVQPATAEAALQATSDERSKEERIRGLASILETALALVVEDYGQLTGHFSHVPAAERILREMVARLRENLTT